MADTQREELARLARLVRNGIYSPNEMRARLGLPALPTEVDHSEPPPRPPSRGGNYTYTLRKGF